MAFTIKDVSGDTLIVGTYPMAFSTNVYYCKRCKVDAPNRKVTVDSSPTVDGSFAQDFGDHSWPITGGSLMFVGPSEADIRKSFEDYAALIKQQIGLTLTIPNQNVSGSTPEDKDYPNCVCTAFELLRRPAPDMRTVIPNDNGSFRAFVAMEFVQLSK